MKALLQRSGPASVQVAGQTLGAIGHGLVVLVCAEPGDSDRDVALFARKIARLRIFADEAGKMNRSVQDIGGAVLAISQFTLAADWRKGNRPGFSGAAGPAEAERLYERFCTLMEAEGLSGARGRFGADMQVSLVNDGPVTIWMDSKEA